MRALASHRCGTGSTPGVNAICGLSLLLVLSLAPRGFSPGTPVFPSPQKPAFPNSNSTRDQVDEEPLCGCDTSKSLFISFVYLVNSYWHRKNDLLTDSSKTNYERMTGQPTIWLTIHNCLTVSIDGSNLFQ